MIQHKLFYFHLNKILSLIKKITFSKTKLLKFISNKFIIK